jgi:hypothetical protein
MDFNTVWAGVIDCIFASFRCRIALPAEEDVMSLKRYFFRSSLFVGLFAICTTFAAAQTTAFDYQGSLKNGASPASGNYDLDFLLYDALSGGTQIGATQSKTNVPIANGVFSAQLDFGSQFPGANRFLEIHVRQSGGGSFTILTPRAKVKSSPYLVKSLNAENAANAPTATNALQLGGVAANQYVLTGDARMTDSRKPSASSTNYILNGTTVQSASNFNISGNGTAGGTLSGNVINSATQFNIGGDRVLSNAGTSNLFAGVSAGSQNTSGSSNSFFGDSAGFGNIFGSDNSYFGWNTGSISYAEGSRNSSFGSGAGTGLTGGQETSYFGYNAKAGSPILINSTAIGANALVENSNSLVLGSINGRNGATADTSVGIGTTAPIGGLNIKRTWDGGNANLVLEGDSPTIRWRLDNGNGQQWLMYGDQLGGYFAIYHGVPNNWGLAKFSIDPTGVVYINDLGSAGSQILCRNASGYISTCSSSLRYKKDVQPYMGGLKLAMKLQPISFAWKEGGGQDVGFGAEDVAKIEPRLTFKNGKGEIEGVNYGQITTVLVNSIKEQQAQIERQQKQIETLTKLVCSLKADSEACKEKER